MSIEFSHNSKSGTWSLSIKRNIFIALGLLFCGSGLASLSAPLWGEILIALLSKVSVDIHHSYQWLIGLLQLLVGLSILAYKYFVVDIRQSRIAKDTKSVASWWQQIGTVREYLSDLGSDHSYWSSLDTVFFHSYTKFADPQFKFLLPDTARLYKSYSDTAEALHNFVGVNFWAFPRSSMSSGDCRYCLAPHLNIDRELLISDPEKDAEYRVLVSQLNSKIAQTEEALDNFVKHLREVGHTK